MPSRTRMAQCRSTPRTGPAGPEPAHQPAPVVGSVCTGYGGLDLGVLTALGAGRIAWCADPDPHISRILAARLPGVPNLGDVRTLDWHRVEPVDVLTAGFPCQDISSAGRRAGIEKGQHSGLWSDIMVGVRLLRPQLLVVENVAALRWRDGGLHRVLADLAEAGYDTLWRSVRAADIGCAHRRERVFLLGWPRSASSCAHAADPDGPRRQGARAWAPNKSPRPSGRATLATLNTAAAFPAQAAADAESHRHRLRRPQSGRGVQAAAVTASDSTGPCRATTADATRDRRDERQSRTAGFQRGSDVAVSGNAPGTSGPESRRGVAPAPASDPTASTVGQPRTRIDWGDYAAAIRRWEQALGRPAPFPTLPGRHGRPVLAPVFVEWLQGLDLGWVSSLPLPRTAQLKALGNGVVPQQAAYAVALLLDDLAEIDRSTSRFITPTERARAA